MLLHFLAAVALQVLKLFVCVSVGIETCMLLHFLAAVAVQVLKLFVCVSVGNETSMLLHFLAMALHVLTLFVCGGE